MRRLTSRFIQRVAAASAGLFLAACASGTGGGAVPLGGDLAAPEAAAQRPRGDVRATPNATVELRVFGAPEFDGTYQVDPDGRLKLPLIEPIDAEGLTAPELAARVEERLGRDYLQDPDVVALITETTVDTLTVDGAVRRPGVYPLDGPTTLLQAVALSGGPDEAANPGKVVVFRDVAGERRAAAYSLVAIRNGKATDPRVFGDDVIVVDGSEFRRSFTDLVRAVPLIGLFFLAL